jgi:beta-glucanase (GH16 family)
MQNKLTILAFIAACCALVATEGDRAGPVKGKLLWSQEFNSIGFPSRDDWSMDVGGGGWGNNELQYYTNRNAMILNGKLAITGRIENIGDNHKYTSSKLVSKKAFKYGVFEARIKMPPGVGTWAAFWFVSDKKPLDWPLDGEIDVVEHIGRTPGDVHVNVHCGKYNHINQTGKGAETHLNNIYDDYHTYTMDWNEHRIKFFVDDKELYMFRKLDASKGGWPFDTDMNLVLNLAIGGNLGLPPSLGIPVEDSAFPTTFYVDYVRQYEKNDIPESSPQLVSIKSKANEKWLSVGNDAKKGHALVAYFDEPNYAETFEYVEMGQTQDKKLIFALKSIVTGLYLSMNSNGPSLMADSETVGLLQTFELDENTGAIRVLFRNTYKYWRTEVWESWRQIIPDGTREKYLLDLNQGGKDFLFELRIRKFL